MWTVQNCARYDLCRPRYPSDLTENEWTLAKAAIPRTKLGGNKRTADVGEVLNGLMYMLSAGCQWARSQKTYRPVAR